MQMNQKKICQKCILPDSFPGIGFDEKGICNHCRKETAKIEKLSGKRTEYRKNFDSLIEKVKGRSPSYDVIMAYSGGKDSTYTLKLLKEQYDLRIVAMSFDNHFISQAAWENIQKAADLLHVDHIAFRPPWATMKAIFSITKEKDIFSKPTLLRASSICTACIGLVKSLVLKNALEMSIPLVAFGWSPGQAPIQSAIMKANPTMIRQTQAALKNAFPPDVMGMLKNYFIPDNYYEIYNERFPQNIHPLAFFEYNEELILNSLTKMGWHAPTDTDTNSSNCLLNALANQVHIERNGFHPYVWEIANMVRQGVMARDDGIEKIYAEQDPKMIRYAKEKLNYEWG